MRGDRADSERRQQEEGGGQGHLASPGVPGGHLPQRAWPGANGLRCWHAGKTKPIMKGPQAEPGAMLAQEGFWGHWVQGRWRRLGCRLSVRWEETKYQRTSMDGAGRQRGAPVACPKCALAMAVSGDQDSAGTKPADAEAIKLLDSSLSEADSWKTLVARQPSPSRVWSTLLPQG